MNKQSLIFKITSLCCLVVDIAFAIFCIISITQVLTKYALLTKIHFTIFIATLVINALYFIYVISILIYNKIRS